MKPLEVSFDEIQKAMEDVRRDRFDYFLDCESGGVIAVPAGVLPRALDALYHDRADVDDDLDVEFDSNVDTAVNLPDQVYNDLEQAIDISLSPERYLRIPERDSAEAFACMREFAGGLDDDPPLRELLLGALDGAQAFRRFKEALVAHPRERKQWHAFNARQMRAVIRRWLSGEGFRTVRRGGAGEDGD